MVSQPDSIFKLIRTEVATETGTIEIYRDPVLDTSLVLHRTPDGTVVKEEHLLSALWKTS